MSFIRLPCLGQAYTYGKTMQQNMPSLKRMSAVAEGGGGDDGGGDGGVQMERAYLNKKGDEVTHT